MIGVRAASDKAPKNMSDPDFDPRSGVDKKRAFELGQDLSALSVDELDALIETLRDEIRRIEETRTKKQAHRNAAADIFNLR